MTGGGYAVPEVPIRFEVGETTIGALTALPDDLEALAIGWLLAEGFLELRDPAPPVAVQDDGLVTVIRAELPPERIERAAAVRRHRREHGCGPLHPYICAPPAPGPGPDPSSMPASDSVPDPSALPSLFRELFAAGPRRDQGGGVHIAALSDGRSLRFTVEEVGRHNAVDKVLGRTLLAGHDPRGRGLVLTARISGEIAFKAARARLGWVASRSVPTDLAVRIARATGVVLIARAAGKEPTLHLPPRRDQLTPSMGEAP